MVYLKVYKKGKRLCLQLKTHAATSAAGNPLTKEPFKGLLHCIIQVV